MTICNKSLIYKNIISITICILLIIILCEISKKSEVYVLADYKESTPIIHIIDDIKAPNRPTINIEKIIDIDVKDIAVIKESEPETIKETKPEKSKEKAVENKAPEAKEILEPAAIQANNDIYEQYPLYAKGSIDGPSGKETYYSLPMDHIVDRMENMGFNAESGWGYWVREDGVKMLGDHVMVAANLDVHPRGSVVMTSVGPGIVCDTGDFAKTNIYQLDIATSWSD